MLVNITTWRRSLATTAPWPRVGDDAFPITVPPHTKRQGVCS